MERVRLRLAVHRPDDPRVPGEFVDGTLHVEADEPVSCRALTVRAAWTVADRSSGAPGEGAAATLPGGEWRGGDRLEFPFRVIVPQGPPTYAGRLVDVRWFLRAEASLSWARDPAVEAPLAVRYAAPADGGRLHEIADSGCFEVGCAWVVVALAAVAFPFVHLVQPPYGVRIVAWIVGGLAAAGSLYAVPRAMAGRRLGNARIEIGPVPARRGSELACRVVLLPRRAMALPPLTAVLEATERSTHGSGKQRRRREEVVSRAEAALQGPASLQPGREAEFAGMIPVPDGGAPTFDAGDTGVKWTLKVTAAVPRLPDVEWSVEVPVGG